MTRAKRYLVRQLIHSNNVHLATIHHELWRAAHVEKAGLTKKELAFLEKRLNTLGEVAADLTRLGTKIHKELDRAG